MLAPLAGIMSEKTVNRIGIPEDIGIPNWGADANEFTKFAEAMEKSKSRLENWAFDEDDTPISGLTSLTISDLNRLFSDAGEDKELLRRLQHFLCFQTTNGTWIHLLQNTRKKGFDTIGPMAHTAISWPFRWGLNNYRSILFIEPVKTPAGNDKCTHQV